MDGPGSDDRGSPDEQRLLTRRRVLAGGVLLVGGGGAAMTRSTDALFQDSNTSSGTVRIDGDPTLNYVLNDHTSNNKVSYTIQYQVEWVANFDHIDIFVENIDDGKYGDQYLGLTSKEDSVSYPSGGGADGGAGGNEYRFTFEVYDTAGLVFSETTTDVAEGTDQSQGSIGSVDSPTLDNFYVTDTTDQNNKATFGVDYLVTNTGDFDEVLVTFENLDKSNKSDSGTNGAADGVVSYGPEGGTNNNSYEITVDVYNTSGIVTDSGTVPITANGTDAQWP